MHGNFFIILKSHFFICDSVDVDECKGNHPCHENANCTNTNGSHLRDCQPGYTGNGQNCTGEFGIARKCGHGWFILVRSFSFCLYNVFCATGTTAVAITITITLLPPTDTSHRAWVRNLLLEIRLFLWTNYDFIPWNKHIRSNIKCSPHAQALLCKLKVV